MITNIAEIPQDYWAWADSSELIPLGVCEGSPVDLLEG